jgi:flagellar motility protein MotE (MotC chaperone)
MRAPQFYSFEKYKIRRKPVSKKAIIITGAAGLVSFAGAFVFAWLTNPSPARRPDESKQPALASGETGLELPRLQIGAIGAANTAPGPAKKTMTEQQLKNLVQDVREKMREYNDKLQGLEVREQRLQVAQDVLKKDIENLNNLQIELTSAIANLKSERDKLLKSRLEINQAEKANLISIAASYDKMDASSAGKILTNLCAGQMEDNEVRGDSSSFDDAVKILHYMTERTKANLLAELATSEPTLAATLCQRLKQIVEGT